jgi:ACR3 family arsenite transporter
MSKEAKPGIGFFERYLTIWVIVCMVVGVLIGKFLPTIPAFLGRFEYANVSIPVAILIWLMIYPMMLKVDFQSIKDVGKNPKGLFVTWITNWLIKPFTMFGIAWFFFYVVFKALIPAELARDYLSGAVLLGAAPCTAMVFVWSHLTKGNPAYTVVQVATNDLMALIWSWRSARSCWRIFHPWMWLSLWAVMWSVPICPASTGRIGGLMTRREKRMQSIFG